MYQFKCINIYLEGTGILTFPEGNLRYEGRFEKNRMHGKG
jgi:hypothetical protein